MVTVQEAPIVNPPETTGTSANEEPKSSSGEVQQRGSGAAPIHDYVDESTKVSDCLRCSVFIAINSIRPTPLDL